MVLAPHDVLDPRSEETLLELAHFFQIGSHVLILRSVLLVGEVDQEL